MLSESTPNSEERDRLILVVRDVDGDYHGTGPLALSGAEAELIADAVLAAGYRPQDEVKAQALDEFANLLYERYPADVFIPPSNDDMQAFRDAAKATGRTLDRFSAEIFRRAAAQAVAEAAEIREESNHE